MKIHKYIPVPKKVKDWENHYVVATRSLENSYGRVPADTILKITSSGILKHLETMKCEHCGFQLKITVKESKEDFLNHFHFIEAKL